jgi:glycerol-1-phosphatase
MPPALKPFMQDYDNVILDLDGCVWVGDEALPGSSEAVAALRQAGKGIVFLTNNAMHTEEEFVRRLWALGFQASVDEIVTPATAIRAVIEEHPDWRRALVVGAVALMRAVEAAGLDVYVPDHDDVHAPDDIDVVIVAAHDDLHFAELRLAAHALARDTPLVATDGDAAYPLPGGPCPGTGSVVALLHAATGAEATIVGKPAPYLFTVAVERLGSGRTLVVGDRLDADIAGAQGAGLDCAIVMTGADTEDAVAAWTPAVTHQAAMLGPLMLTPAPA